MVDCDNVICNLQKVVIDVFNKRYGTSYTLADFSRYNVSECLPKEEAINMVNIYNEPGIYDLVKPLPGAQSDLQKLIRAGHEIYIVTDADPSIYEEKANWIKFHFPYIDNAHIICMKHKWLFKCHVMVEDKLDNLVNGHHYERICFNYPWNQAHDEVYDIYRVEDWDDILDSIKEIEKRWSDVT